MPLWFNLNYENHLLQRQRNCAAFTKDFIGWLQVANPDIICIQESKAE